MKKIALFIISMTCFINIEAQEEYFNIYLEDTLYFGKKNIFELIEEANNKEEYLKYFSSTSGLEFYLKDSLDDGCYRVYTLTKQQLKKIKDPDKYLVAQGCFKNKRKHGKFLFTNGINKLELGSIYKEISFVNDTVHGKVIEMTHGNLNYLTEYKMGIKDGFYFWWYKGSCLIILYKKGEIIEESTFDIYP